MGSGAQMHPELDARFAAPRTFFFGVGAQKSGTSWVNYFLKQHPEVVTPAIKELNYWRVVERGGSPGRITESYQEEIDAGVLEADGVDLDDPKIKRIQCAKYSLSAAKNPRAPHGDYADAIFAGDPAPDCVAAGEISPSYATLKAATYREMASLAANVRFLFLMRDPLARFESGLRHALKRVPDPEKVTQDDFDQIVEGALGGYKHRNWVAMSQYHKTIERLEKVVDPARVGYFFFETLFDQATVDRLCDFLGISRQVAEFDRVVNAGAAKHVGFRGDQKSRVAALFSPTYRLVREKFGAAVPAAWEASEALAMKAEAEL